jgi:hypothetical protein
MLIMYIQHLLDINVALFFYHLCIHFYTPVIMKINPVGYTPLPSIVHTLTSLDVPARFSHPIFCLQVFVVHPGTTFFP